MTAPAWLLASVCSLGACGAPFTNAGDGPELDAGGALDAAATPAADVLDAQALDEVLVDGGAHADRARMLEHDAGDAGDVDAAPGCMPQVECMGSSAGAVCGAPWRPCTGSAALACGAGTVCCTACL